MLDKLTERARKAITYARHEAQRLGAHYIGTEHLLLGLIREGTGMAAAVLQKLGVDPRRIRFEVEKTADNRTDAYSSGRQLPYAAHTKKTLEYAVEEAKKLGHNYVGTEHLLLGLLREKDGVAAQVLLSLGVDREQVRDVLLNLSRPPAANSTLS